MRDEPGWWYAKDGGWRARALSPAASVYGWAAERRWRRRQPYRSRLPVVCVGNFTAGGTGKTPLSLLIARELTLMGEKPAFLTRGYGGRIKGPHWVDPLTDSPEDVGDEPLLLVREAPAMVARDRRAGARTIEGSPIPASVIVMDDGLQNPSLAKDVTLALVDGERGIGNGRLIPAGPLRAPMELQLRLTDAIIVTGRRAATAEGEDGAEGEDRAGALLEKLRKDFPGPVLSATAEPAADMDWLKGANVVAYAGIGNPERFFGLLERLGAKVAARIVFADHHPYGESDAKRLLGLAEASQAALVTTEKDWVRLRAGGGAVGRLKAASATLPIRLVLDERDHARLADMLATAARTGGYRSGVKGVGSRE